MRRAAIGRHRHHLHLAAAARTAREHDGAPVADQARPSIDHNSGVSVRALPSRSTTITVPRSSKRHGWATNATWAPSGEMRGSLK